MIKWNVNKFIKTGKTVWPITADHKGKRLEITECFSLGFSTTGMTSGPDYFSASVRELKPDHANIIVEYRKYRTVKTFNAHTLKGAKKRLEEFMK